MSLGRQIRIARMSQGITAAELSRLTDINKSYLSRVENDLVPGVSVEMIKRICRALSVEPNVILEWDKERHVEGAETQPQ